MDQAWALLDYLNDPLEILLIFLYNTIAKGTVAHMGLAHGNRRVEVLKDSTKSRTLRLCEWSIAVDDPLNDQTLEVLSVK